MRAFVIQHATDITDLANFVEANPPDYTMKNAEGIYSAYQGTERTIRVTMADLAFALQVETVFEHGEKR